MRAAADRSRGPVAAVVNAPALKTSPMRTPEPVDCGQLIRSPCCRACGLVVAFATAFWALAPLTFATLAWRILPDFESQAGKMIVFMASGIVYQPGDEWSFECIKRQCPVESLRCLLAADCRRYVVALSFPDRVQNAGESCSREVLREATCGSRCSRATVAYSACLEEAGRGCVHSTDGLPFVLHRDAITQHELELIAAIGREQRATPGNHVNRTFGTTDGTTGHVVTWLTPPIHRHTALTARLFELARASSVAAGWQVPSPERLTMRCAPRRTGTGACASLTHPTGAYSIPPEPGRLLSQTRACRTLPAQVRRAPRVWREWRRHRSGVALGRRLHAHHGRHDACICRGRRLRRAADLDQLLCAVGGAAAW